MAIDQYPYSDFHELNADWMLKTIKAAKQDAETAAESAETAATTAASALETAEQAVLLAQQALAAIPTAQDLAWSPTPNNDYFIVPAANNVSDALNMAYPKYIEFEQVSGNQFRAQLSVPIETMVNPIGRGLKLDAVIYTQYSMNRLMLSDYRFTANKIKLAWIGTEAAGGDSAVVVLQTELDITPTSETTVITANRIIYPLLEE